MRSSTKVAWLAAGCGVLAGALWSWLPEVAQRGERAAEVAVEPKSGPATVSSLAVTLDAVATPERSAPERPMIRGHLINSLTGLPLAGYTVELRPAAFRTAQRGRISLNQMAASSGTARARGELVAFATRAAARPSTGAINRGRIVAYEPPPPEGSVRIHAIGQGAVSPDLAPMRSLEVAAQAVDDAKRMNQRVIRFNVNVADADRIVRVETAASAMVGKHIEIKPASVSSEIHLDAPIATAVTDARGFFSFECPGDPGAYLELVPKEHDFVSELGYAFARSESMCSEEFDWRVAVSSGSVLHGRVLDARTTAPLEGVTVELRGENDCVESVTTDADGRFSSTKVFPVGHLGLKLSEGKVHEPIAVEPQEAEITGRERAEDELVLVASIGPTWRFRFEESSVATDSGGGTGEMVMAHGAHDVELRLVGTEPWPGWDGAQDPFREWQGLRAGDPDWMRYPVTPKCARGGPRAEFRTHDLAWAGSATLGTSGGVTLVTLHPTARVRGRVTIAGEGDASALLLRACRAGGDAEAMYEFAYSDRDGRFEITGVDANAVRCLEVVNAGVVLRRIELALAAGEDRELEIGL